MHISDESSKGFLNKALVKQIIVELGKIKILSKIMFII